jgi:germination protein M
MRRIHPLLLLGVVLSLLLAGCGNDVTDAGPVTPDAAPDETTDPDPDPDDEPAPAPDDETTDEPDDGDANDDRTDDSTDDGTDDVDDTTNGSSDDDGTNDQTSDTDRVTLYFVAPGGGTMGRADPFLVAVEREIPATRGIAVAALRELVDGPTAADEALIDGVASSVPSETLVLGMTIDDGLATVDLSREFESGGGSFSMIARLAQLTYTVTQFPTVDEVELRLDGRAVTTFSNEGLVFDGTMTREGFIEMLPTIFVDSPAAGSEAATPLRITGMAAVFEATFQYRVETADGTVLAEGFAMSDEGQGWGTFDVTIDVDVDRRTEATLTVFEYSAKDGSVQAERTTPLTLLP